MPSFSLPPMNSQRLADAVYAILREHILARAFAPGERLDIQEISRQLKVSRTPVKDALNKLASEGLVEVVPRKGTFVATLSPDEVVEVFEVRRALELLAAELLVGRVSEEDLAQVRTRLNDLEKSFRRGVDAEEHMRRNMAFHRLLVELSGNRTLLKVYDGLNVHIQIARIHASGQQWKDRAQQEHEEHVEIVDALAARDFNRLAAALDAHIRRAKQALIQDLQTARAASGGTRGREVTGHQLQEGLISSWGGFKR
jgi:DNA-binding GntR family transcriptional regulator